MAYIVTPPTPPTAQAQELAQKLVTLIRMCREEDASISTHDVSIAMRLARGELREGSLTVQGGGRISDRRFLPCARHYCLLGNVRLCQRSQLTRRLSFPYLRHPTENLSILCKASFRILLLMVEHSTLSPRATAARRECYTFANKVFTTKSCISAVISG